MSDKIQFKNVVRKIGNSIGVIIPTSSFEWETIKVKEGDIIEVTVRITGKNINDEKSPTKQALQPVAKKAEFTAKVRPSGTPNVDEITVPKSIKEVFGVKAGDKIVVEIKEIHKAPVV